MTTGTFPGLPPQPENRRRLIILIGSIEKLGTTVPDDPTPPQSHPRYLTVLDADMCHHHSAAIVLTVATGLLAIGSLAAFSARHEMACAALAVIAAICGHAALSMYSAGTRLRGLRAFAADHASGRAYFAAGLAHVRQDADQHLGLMLRAAADEVPRLRHNGIR